MNGTSNSRAGRVRAGFWAALLPLFAAFAAGCSNHGPVNLFSPELFHHYIGGANLTFYDANNNTYNTTTPVNGCGNCYSTPNAAAFQSLTITVVNDGGAGTYGPVSVSMTSSDGHLVWSWAGSGANSSYAFNLPPSQGQNIGLAVSDFCGQQEILSGDQTSVPLAQGTAAECSQPFNTNDSASFYYTPNPAYAYGVQITVPITLLIWDGLGNEYTSTFNIYVTQNFNANQAPYTSYVDPSPADGWTGQ